MSTNPNNAVGTNGAFGGRTSVNAFNDVLGVFKSRGIVSGWGIVPDSGMDVAVGGDGSTRDVAIAEDNIGNKTTVNNISQQPVTVSIPAAPASNSRIDLVVAYVDNPAQGVATETDNYGACGLIVVSGASAANPVAPDETAIRTAITTDGGAGSVAYYVVLGSVTVASGTTDISSNMISAGAFAAVKSDNVEWETYDMTDIFTPSSSLFSVSGKLNKQGNILAGTFTVTRSSGTFGDFSSSIGSFIKGFRPKWGLVTFAVLFSDYVETATSQTGYCRILDTGSLTITGYGTSGKTRARITLFCELA